MAQYHSSSPHDSILITNTLDSYQILLLNILTMNEIHDSEYKDYGFTDMTPEMATSEYVRLQKEYDRLENTFVRVEDRLSKETDEAIRNVLEIELQTIEKQKDIVEKEITLIKDNYVLLTEE